MGWTASRRRAFDYLADVMGMRAKRPLVGGGAWSNLVDLGFAALINDGTKIANEYDGLIFKNGLYAMMSFPVGVVSTNIGFVMLGLVIYDQPY